jgi:hypothetical protein
MDPFPRNELEYALSQAASDAASRSVFFKLVLGSRIFAIGHAPDSPADQPFRIAAGDTLSLEHWTGADGQTYIPFFTSLDALQQSVERQVSYLAILGRELFDSTRGKSLILNPGQPHGHAFSPRDIERLLATGDVAPVAAQPHDATPPVEIGQPKDYPVALIEGLTRLFARHGAIRRAYIALMKDSSTDRPFSLLLGLDLDGELDLQSTGLGHVTADHAPDGLPVDILVLSETEDGPSRYFREQAQPFYERRWGQRLMAFFVRP